MPDGTENPGQEWGELEQRVWELFGQSKTTSEIAEELGIGYWEASDLSARVYETRGSPNLEVVRKCVEEMKAIHFV